ILRPRPVFGGEAVEGERFEAEVRALGDDRPDHFRTALMAPRAVLAAGLRPSAVAIHDDGQVPGQHGLRVGVGRLVHGRGLGCVACFMASTNSEYYVSIRADWSRLGPTLARTTGTPRNFSIKPR